MKKKSRSNPLTVDEAIEGVFLIRRWRGLKTQAFHHKQQKQYKQKQRVDVNWYNIILNSENTEKIYIPN